MKSNKKFKVVSNYNPSGDQPKAIDSICKGLKSNSLNQVLMGITGSGKTYTMSGADSWQLRGIIPRVLSMIYD